ncbi:MAG: undecaprenyldiphospho-muramoylpentapeptide beta-N-acetylglucosaminyltransferase [Bacillota bacterium]
MKILITGGGTGGHIYPALSAAKKLEDEGGEVLYVGSRESLESEIVTREEISFQGISVAPLPRKINFSLFKAVLVSTAGFFQSLNIIRKFKPDVVFGTGGFVAGPVVLAGSILGARTLIHEQNIYPGITNKLLSYVVDKIALNFPGAIQYFPGRAQKKFVVTGNPVREKIMTARYKEGIKQLNLDEHKKTVLAFGGSQGAESINRAMGEVCRQLAGNKDIQIIYITGQGKYDQVLESLGPVAESSNLHIKSYLHNIELAYAASDLVVCRAGATGLAEITVRGLPAILIPYPYASGNHQDFNARFLEDNQAALVISDSKLNGTLLLEKINKLLSDKNLLNKMAHNSKELGHPEALENIIEEINNW